MGSLQNLARSQPGPGQARSQQLGPRARECHQECHQACPRGAWDRVSGLSRAASHQLNSGAGAWAALARAWDSSSHPRRAAGILCFQEKWGTAAWAQDPTLLTRQSSPAWER